MLTLFFALASAASIRGWQRRRAAASGRPTDTEQQHAADWLDRAAIATFSIEAPVRGSSCCGVLLQWERVGARQSKFAWRPNC